MSHVFRILQRYLKFNSRKWALFFPTKMFLAALTLVFVWFVCYSRNPTQSAKPVTSHAQMELMRQAPPLNETFTDSISTNSDINDQDTAQDHQSQNTSSSTTTATKWIVVTTIHSPTIQIHKLNMIPDWQLLVVADQATPNSNSNWDFPNVIFLNVDSQMQLSYAILKYLPWNSYTRKVIGYLYAIQHGADFIYDTDDNALDDPSHFEKSFVFDSKSGGLMTRPTFHKADVIKNPYAHFGHDLIKPRGFPSNRSGFGVRHAYSTCKIHTPIIQQGLVNGNPDVGAHSQNPQANIEFDKYAPPLILSKSHLAPFNSKNTLFHYNAFWALFLPSSVPFRDADIWRGYWAQPLLWTIGSRLGFYPPSSHMRRSTQYTRPAINTTEENKFNKQYRDLITLARKFNCSTNTNTLYGCMTDFSTLIGANNLWASTEVDAMAAWISDLTAIGYQPPNLNRKKLCLSGKPSPVRFFANRNSTGISKPDRHLLQKFCDLPIPSIAHVPNPEYPSTLLVITYNHLHLENIWLLDAIYRPHFPNILFCADTPRLAAVWKFLAAAKTRHFKTSRFSFVYAQIDDGKFAYDCGLRAIDMNYGVSGYLVMSDDILFNFWNTFDFDLNKAWMLESKSEPWNLQNELPTNHTWGWWYSEFGVNAIQPALEQIYKNSKSNTNFQEFLQNRKSHGLNSSVALRGISDVLYFPAAKQDIFYDVGSVMKEWSVFLEVAVPALMTGISPKNKILLMPGVFLWGNRRTVSPMQFFNESSFMLHPVKYGWLMKHAYIRFEYCKMYISKVVAM